MAHARLVPQRRILRFVAALAILPALVSVSFTDAARADDDELTPAAAGPVGTPTVGTPTVEAPAITATTTTLIAGTSTPALRLGAKGADVLRLQRRLRELGYDVGKVHGGFGNDTLHAVRAFQKVQGTTVDGRVTATTWAQLDEPVVPDARYTGSDAGVEVDLTKRVLYLTRDGAVTAVFDVSPGKASTPTVTGRYTIYRRVNRWDYGPLGGLYRPNYFHRGFALHGSGSVPTYSASHGCVRLTPASMDRLWSMLAVRERVSVYRS